MTGLLPHVRDVAGAVRSDADWETRESAEHGATVAADLARDRLVAEALLLAGSVRADMRDEKVTDGLVALVLRAEAYCEAQGRLARIKSEGTRP
jgi:hypothetical protein